MTALSPNKYLEYTREFNRICDPILSERDVLRLIKTICEENSNMDDGSTTAMGFIWQVATAAVGPIASPRQGSLL